MLSFLFSWPLTARVLPSNIVATIVYRYSVVSVRVAFIRSRNCSLPGVKPLQAGVCAPHALSQTCHIPKGTINMLGFDAVCPNASTHCMSMQEATTIARLITGSSRDFWLPSTLLMLLRFWLRRFPTGIHRISIVNYLVRTWNAQRTGTVRTVSTSRNVYSSLLTRDLVPAVPLEPMLNQVDIIVPINPCLYMEKCGLMNC